MGLFGKLFGAIDPTRGWVASPELNLVFDLSQHSLCGVRPGEELDLLRRLGPAEDPRAARLGMFRYYSKGFEVSSDGNSINAYTLVWDDVDREGFSPFVGVCKYRGLDVLLDELTSEDELVAIFGSPYWRDIDDEEILLFYEHDVIEWQIELSRNATLRRIIVVSPPLMESAEQRLAYGVTRAWPPPYS